MLFLFSLPCVEHVYPASLRSLVKQASFPPFIFVGKTWCISRRLFCLFCSFWTLSLCPQNNVLCLFVTLLALQEQSCHQLFSYPLHFEQLYLTCPFGFSTLSVWLCQQELFTWIWTLVSLLGHGRKTTSRLLSRKNVMSGLESTWAADWCPSLQHRQGSVALWSPGKSTRSN